MKRIPAILLVALLTGLSLGIAQDPRGNTHLVEPPTTAVPREGCVTESCHPDIKDHNVLHGPLNVNGCDACHRMSDPQAHAFEMTKDIDELCRVCHDMNLTDHTFLHKPLEAGQCVPCHDPHGGPTRALLRGETQAEMCRQCHPDVMAATRSVHGPAASDNCGACHSAHGSSYPMLLNQPGEQVCLPCHLDVQKQLEQDTYTHDPVTQDCQLCHDAHASDHIKLLHLDPIEQCVGCHAHIEEIVETAIFGHEAILTERSCVNCHGPHSADRPRLLRKNIMIVCFECHNKEISARDGRTIPNMQALIETGRSLHGPTAEHDCTVCHDVHGGGHRRLLRFEYPMDIYYPFEEGVYALCFSCHDRQLVMEQQTTLTDFRNGLENLHYVHVNKDKKGRTCSICHNAHAAQREHIIHEEIPFGPGGWMLPIRFESTDEGGRCAAGCHRAYEYNRHEPLTYPTSKEPVPDPPDTPANPTSEVDKTDIPLELASAALTSTTLRSLAQTHNGGVP